MALHPQAALVTLASPQLEALVPFYRQLLAQDPHPYLPGRYAEFAVCGLRLGIFVPRASHRAEFGQPAGSGMSLCLEVASLEGAIACCERLGHPPPAPITEASHGRETYAYDPGGNRLILHQSR